MTQYPQVLSEGKYYIVYRTQYGSAIWCKPCNKVSHNQGDVDNKYCGNCGIFLHDQETREVAAERLDNMR